MKEKRTVHREGSVGSGESTSVVGHGRTRRVGGLEEGILSLSGLSGDLSADAKQNWSENWLKRGFTRSSLPISRVQEVRVGRIHLGRGSRQISKLVGGESSRVARVSVFVEVRGVVVLRGRGRSERCSLLRRRVRSGSLEGRNEVNSHRRQTSSRRGDGPRLESWDRKDREQQERFRYQIHLDRNPLEVDL